MKLYESCFQTILRTRCNEQDAPKEHDMKPLLALTTLLLLTAQALPAFSNPAVNVCLESCIESARNAQTPAQMQQQVMACYARCPNKPPMINR